MSIDTEHSAPDLLPGGQVAQRSLLQTPMSRHILVSRALHTVPAELNVPQTIGEDDALSTDSMEHTGGPYDSQMHTANSSNSDASDDEEQGGGGASAPLYSASSQAFAHVAPPGPEAAAPPGEAVAEAAHSERRRFWTPHTSTRSGPGASAFTVEPPVFWRRGPTPDTAAAGPSSAPQAGRAADADEAALAAKRSTESALSSLAAAVLSAPRHAARGLQPASADAVRSTDELLRVGPRSVGALASVRHSSLGAEMLPEVRSGQSIDLASGVNLDPVETVSSWRMTTSHNNTMRSSCDVDTQLPTPPEQGAE